MTCLHRSPLAHSFLLVATLLCTPACGGSAGDAPPSPRPDADAAETSSDTLLDPDVDGIDTAPPDCSGTFGAPQLVLEDQTIVGVAVTGDELELAYVRGPSFDERNEPWLARRGAVGEGFKPDRRLDELLPWCKLAFWDLDITADGLRAYFSCYEGVPAARVTDSVHMARRASRTAPFEHVGTFSGKTRLGKVALDELSHSYSDPLVHVYAAKRATREESFGEAKPVPGLESVMAGPLSLSLDATIAYLSFLEPGSIYPKLGVVRRASTDAPFGAIEQVGAFGKDDAPSNPHLVRHCRALYFTNGARAFVMRR